MRNQRHIARRMLSTVLVGTAIAATQAADQPSATVSGNFKWGGKGGTIAGTLVATETAGTYTVRLVPKWGGKDKSGYDGTITIAESGAVTGSITHAKEGTYALTGTFADDKLTCQYQGKKSKKDNPVNLTIQRTDAEGS